MGAAFPPRRAKSSPAHSGLAPGARRRPPPAPQLCYLDLNHPDGSVVGVPIGRDIERVPRSGLTGKDQAVRILREPRSKGGGTRGR